MLAAVLAVIGYSLNDTIVVFDRIRENLLRIRKTATVDVINLSINQMLARTLTTSRHHAAGAVGAVFPRWRSDPWLFVALIVGVVIGTYSSIYIASPTALALDLSAADLLPPEKDTSELDQLP